MRAIAYVSSVLTLALVCCETMASDDPLDEVIVERSRYSTTTTIGTKAPRALREIPSSVSVITAQRIEDQNLATVDGALSQVTGVTVVPDNPLTSAAYSRGYAMSLMFDGVPAMGQLNGVRLLDAAIYERIEVQRGASGLFQGTGEPGGSVNVVRKRGGSEYGLTGSYSLATWDNHRSIVDATGPLTEDGAVRARVVGVYHDRGHYTSAHYQRRTGYATVDWAIGSRTTLSAYFIAQHDHSRRNYSGLPIYESGRQLEVPRSTDIAAHWSRRHEDTQEHGASLTQQLWDSWKIEAHWRTNREDTWLLSSSARSKVNDADSTLLIGRSDTLWDVKYEGLDIFASGDVSILGRVHSLALGYSESVFNNDFVIVERISATQSFRVPLAETAFVPELDLPYERFGKNRRKQSGYYAQARISLHDRLTLTAGGRLSDVNTYQLSGQVATPARFFSLGRANDEFTPMAGIVFDANQWLSMYASYSDIFIPQSALRADGTPLDPRVGRQYEVGAKSSWYEGALQASVSIFNLRDTGRALADEMNPGFSIAAGEVESKGWETEIVGSPALGYEIQAGYARTDARYTKAEPRLQGTAYSFLTPKHSWKIWAVRRGGNGLTIGAGVNGQSRFELAPLAQGSYSIANAMVSYQITDTMSIAFHANNLFDKVYYARLGTLSSNIFGPPRNFALTLRASL